MCNKISINIIGNMSMSISNHVSVSISISDL